MSYWAVNSLLLAGIFAGLLGLIGAGGPGATLAWSLCLVSLAAVGGWLVTNAIHRLPPGRYL